MRSLVPTFSAWPLPSKVFRSKIHTLLAAALLLISANAAWADEWDDANVRIRADLERAAASLEATRREITAEKIPLLQSVRSAEREVAELRRELERQRRLRDNRDLDLSQLRGSVEARREQINYATSLLEAYARNFEARISMAELQRYGEAAQRARQDEARQDAKAQTDASLQRQLELIATALGRLESLQGGGKTFAGRALSQDGALEQGAFAVIGPWTFFVSDDSPLTGIAFTRVNAAEATVADTGPEFAAGLRTLLESGTGTIPGDGSLGRALQIEMTRDGFRAHIAKGGYVGWVILGLGAVALALALFKLVDLARVHAPSAERVERLLQALEQGDMDKARVEAEAERPGGRDLLQAVVEGHGEARILREEIIYERLLTIRPILERFLPFIAITAAAAPLLGLLGTVTGMIKTFNLITLFGTGDAKSLSSGISEALITTELGLCVAIPALIIHGLLVRNVKHKLGQLEQTAVGILNATEGKAQK